MSLLVLSLPAGSGTITATVPDDRSDPLSARVLDIPWESSTGRIGCGTHGNQGVLYVTHIGVAEGGVSWHGWVAHGKRLVQHVADRVPKTGR